MRVRLTIDRGCACFRSPHKVFAGQVVDASPAVNLPDYEALGLLWVDFPDECYGILLEREDYTTV